MLKICFLNIYSNEFAFFHKLKFNYQIKNFILKEYILAKRFTGDIRTEFKRLQNQNNLDGIIEYLSSILSANDADNLLAGFCYWNISDSYAMQRKSEELYANHLNFCKLLDKMDSKYKFWSVCDATQRFTLELGGYGDFWWRLYNEAVDSNPNTTDIERIVFDTHVAAISINPKVETPKFRLYLAKDNFEQFVKNSVNPENEAFYYPCSFSWC